MAPPRPLPSFLLVCSVLFFALLAKYVDCQLQMNLDAESKWNAKDVNGKRYYDPRLDPANPKFDCKYWWDHIMAKPELYHENWRPYHDPDDSNDIWNAAKNHPACMFKVWYKMKEWEQGNYPWNERRPRPDPYYTRPVVITDSGIVRGYNVTAERRIIWNPLFPKEEYHIDKSISIFLGIPYARPPVREARFERPDIAKVWAPRELDASRYRNACLQIDDGDFIKMWQPGLARNISEDCLYLNIFAPNYTYPRTMKQFQHWRPTDQNYPVLVFFHGGDFVKGSASLYPGHILAQKNIIVVTVNYRLGPLGFLSTGTKDAPGNYGLWDQWRALQWIHENIGYFYGDNEKVTIMGDEAGAVSALLHTYSKWSRPYFHQVIAHGGSELAPGAVTFRQYLYEIEANRPSRPRHHAEQLAQLLGCSIPSDQDRLYESYYEYALRQMRDCLKDWRYAAKESNIRKVTRRIPREPDNPPWHPVVDDSIKFPFLNLRPQEKAEQGEIGDIPIIAGLDADAGSDFIESLNITGIDEGLTEEEFTDLVNKFVLARNRRYTLYDETNGPHLAIIHYDRIENAVRFAYTNWQNQKDDKGRLQKAIDMLTDYYVTAPIVDTLKLHGKFNNKTWMYVFDHRSDQSKDPLWKGVSSGKAMEYAFGFPWINKTEDPRWIFWDHIRHFNFNFHRRYNDIDRNVSNITMELIASYVKFGKPTLLDPEKEREVPLGFKWNYYDDFMRNLSWPLYEEGNQHLTINQSLHQPYNCTLKYVFDPTDPIGDSNGRFGENVPIIINWAQWNDFISEFQKWRLMQTDYEKARTRFSCWRRYRERQRMINNSQNFRQHEVGFWNDYYSDISVRNITKRHLQPTIRPKVAYMSSSVYQGIVFTLVAILFVLCVAAISICLCPRNEKRPPSSLGTNNESLHENMLDVTTSFSRDLTPTSLASRDMLVKGSSKESSEI